MNEPLDLATATEQALDYAATRCRACASGTLRCQRHADEDDFIADTLEKFGEALQQQVYEAETDTGPLRDQLDDILAELESKVEKLLAKHPAAADSKLRAELFKILRETV